MKQLLFALLFSLLFTGCGKIKDIFGLNQDEMTGLASAPVPTEKPEEPVPYPPNRKIYSSVGFYAHGYLWSRDEITSTDLYDVRPSTVREGHNYVSIYITDVMNRLFREYYKKSPASPRLTLWDMSNSMGGPSAGHLSHQNGLDVDVEYLYISKTPAYGHLYVSKDVVEDTKTPAQDVPKDIAHIDYGNLWIFAQTMAESGKVRRMFVDARIKKFLCSLHAGEAGAVDTLRRLRPYPNHDAHIHVRFMCPKEDSKCVDQVEVPTEAGC